MQDMQGCSKDVQIDFSDVCLDFSHSFSMFLTVNLLIFVLAFDQI